MERHEILSQDVDWRSLIHHVSRDQVTVELSEGEVPVARLVPMKKHMTMAELDHILRKLPSLGEDAESFEKDLHDVKSTMKDLDDPSES